MTGKQTSYMKSAFPRVPDDYYPTVDTRCMDGLLWAFPEIQDAMVVDMCAPKGSGITKYLKRKCKGVLSTGDAFAYPLVKSEKRFEQTLWGITNPPYIRGLVEPVIWRQIERVEAYEILGLAVLLRNNWDHWHTRARFFNHKHYMGQVKLCFRPFWNDERHQLPFHDFTWQVWGNWQQYHTRTWHYYAPADPAYQVERKGKRK